MRINGVSSGHFGSVQISLDTLKRKQSRAQPSLFSFLHLFAVQCCGIVVEASLHSPGIAPLLRSGLWEKRFPRQPLGQNMVYRARSRHTLPYCPMLSHRGHGARFMVFIPVQGVHLEVLNFDIDINYASWTQTDSARYRWCLSFQMNTTCPNA